MKMLNFLIDAEIDREESENIYEAAESRDLRTVLFGNNIYIHEKKEGLYRPPG